MTYQKDFPNINHRSEQKDVLKSLAKIILTDHYEEQLLPLPRTPYEHADNHSGCTYSDDAGNADRITEKRICRCWNYCNKNIHKEKCLACSFGFKKSNKGDIAILDYEVPTKFNMEKLGGIDWLLSDGAGEIAAEVKPPDSPETLVRMIAEILTYTIGTDYTPAICFFKTQQDGTSPSAQMRDYMTYKDNADFLSIKHKTGLRVLYITFDDSSFMIHDTEKEPLV